MLIANKADLTYTPGERVVSTAEGRQRAEEIEAHAFHEISVRESVEQVNTDISIFLFTCRGDDSFHAGTFFILAFVLYS